MLIIKVLGSLTPLIYQVSPSLLIPTFNKTGVPRSLQKPGVIRESDACMLLDISIPKAASANEDTE